MLFLWTCRGEGEEVALTIPAKGRRWSRSSRGRLLLISIFFRHHYLRETSRCVTWPWQFYWSWSQSRWSLPLAIELIPTRNSSLSARPCDRLNRWLRDGTTITETAAAWQAEEYPFDIIATMTKHNCQIACLVHGRQCSLVFMVSLTGKNNFWRLHLLLDNSPNIIHTTTRSAMFIVF